MRLPVETRVAADRKDAEHHRFGGTCHPGFRSAIGRGWACSTSTSPLAAVDDRMLAIVGLKAVREWLTGKVEESMVVRPLVGKADHT